MMGRNILLFVMFFTQGCFIPAVTLPTIFSGVTAVSTAGNQTYQAYKTNQEGDEVMKCLPQGDGSFICKPERIKQETPGAGKDSSPSPPVSP